MAQFFNKWYAFSLIPLLLNANIQPLNSGLVKQSAIKPGFHP